MCALTWFGHAAGDEIRSSGARWLGNVMMLVLFHGTTWLLAYMTHPGDTHALVISPRGDGVGALDHRVKGKVLL